MFAPINYGVVDQFRRRDGRPFARVYEYRSSSTFQFNPPAETRSLVRARARAEEARGQRVEVERGQRKARHVVDPETRAELAHLALTGTRELLLLMLLLDVIRRRAVLQILKAQRALQSAEGRRRRHRRDRRRLLGLLATAVDS